MERPCRRAGAADLAVVALIRFGVHPGWSSSAGVARPPPRLAEGRLRPIGRDRRRAAVWQLALLPASAGEWILAPPHGRTMIRPSTRRRAVRARSGPCSAVSGAAISGRRGLVRGDDDVGVPTPVVLGRVRDGALPPTSATQATRRRAAPRRLSSPAHAGLHLRSTSREAASPKLQRKPRPLSLIRRLNSNQTPLLVEPDPKPILNITRDTVVCERAVIADRPLRRMRGLLGRASLGAGEGLLLQPAPSVHTAFMRFPIDVVFLDRNIQVVKLVESLVPWRMAAARHARSTLELAAGEAAARGIRVGDRLRLVTVADDPSDVQILASANGGRPHDSALDTRTESTESEKSLRVTRRSADHIHVLLVGLDRRFRAVTAALLTRRGCAVTYGGRITGVAEFACQERADVVVIDAGSLLRAAALEASRVETLDPPVGVVIVADEREGGGLAGPVLPKWGSFDELYGAIASACPNGARRSSNGGS